MMASELKPLIATALAATLAIASGVATAASPDVGAAQKAVRAALPKGAHVFFSSVYESRSAVCGVVTGAAVGEDGDSRFLVTLKTDAKGHRQPDQVSIEALAGDAFPATWAADCASP